MYIAHNEEELDWMGSDCWFCGKQPPTAGKSYTVTLTRAGLQSQVCVPRCVDCHAAHRRILARQSLAGWAGMTMTFLVLVVWSPFELAWWIKALLVLLGFLAALIPAEGNLPPNIRPMSTALQFRAVQLMRRGGWRMAGE